MYYINVLTLEIEGFKLTITRMENLATKDKKIMEIFSAQNMDRMADNTALEAALNECYAADYHEEYHSQGFFLMLMIDEEPGENRKNFWKIIGPTGKEYELPQLEFSQKSYTYRKPTYSQFQVMVQIIKAGERI